MILTDNDLRVLLDQLGWYYNYRDTSIFDPNSLIANTEAFDVLKQHQNRRLLNAIGERIKHDFGIDELIQDDPVRLMVSRDIKLELVVTTVPKLTELINLILLQLVRKDIVTVNTTSGAIDIRAGLLEVLRTFKTKSNTANKYSPHITRPGTDSSSFSITLDKKYFPTEEEKQKLCDEFNHKLYDEDELV